MLFVLSRTRRGKWTALAMAILMVLGTVPADAAAKRPVPAPRELYQSQALSVRARFSSSHIIAALRPNTLRTLFHLHDWIAPHRGAVYGWGIPDGALILASVLLQIQDAARTVASGATVIAAGVTLMVGGAVALPVKRLVLVLLWLNDIIDSGGPETNRIQVDEARSAEEMDAVYELTYENYLLNHYTEPREDRRLIHYPEFDEIPQTTVLVARSRGKIIATVSFTVDGPLGFTMEKDFKDEIRGVRERHRRNKVVAIWRLVTDEKYRNSPRVVIALMARILIFVLRNNMDALLFTVNPKHESNYVRLLQMKVIGRSNGTGGLNNAPAVLLYRSIGLIPSLPGGKTSLRRMSRQLIKLLTSGPRPRAWQHRQGQPTLAAA